MFFRPNLASRVQHLGSSISGLASRVQHLGSRVHDCACSEPGAESARGNFPPKRNASRSVDLHRDLGYAAGESAVAINLQLLILLIRNSCCSGSGRPKSPIPRLFRYVRTYLLIPDLISIHRRVSIFINKFLISRWFPSRRLPDHFSRSFPYFPVFCYRIPLQERIQNIGSESSGQISSKTAHRIPIEMASIDSPQWAEDMSLQQFCIQSPGRPSKSGKNLGRGSQ